MRISDWSSDVCSSDLAAAAQAGFGHRLDDAGRTKRQGLRHAAIAAMGLVVVERQRIDNAAAGKGQAGLALEEGQILGPADARGMRRSEEHTSELQSLMSISYAVFCLNKNIKVKKKT